MLSKQASVSTFNSTNFYKFNFKIPDGFNISKNDSEIYLVLDVSGSMGSVIPQVKTALKEFLKKLPADSNIKLYTFESFPHFIYGGKINSTLFSKINEIRSMGGTNFTAINLKLAEDISKSGFKNINVVYFTDGCDGSSFYRTNSPTSINYGIDKTRKATAFLILLPICAIAYFQHLQYNDLFNSIYINENFWWRNFIATLYTLFLQVLLIILLIKVTRSNTKSEFHSLSKLCKIIILFGILSIPSFHLLYQN